MAKMKSTTKYYFSVEGETEKWYLDWLQEQINNYEDAKFKVSFDIKIQKNPLKRVKGMNIINKTEIIHICDYESNDSVHTKQFIEIIDNMKKATSLGKQIKYVMGYSNFTFELWIILHKIDCNSSISHRRQYLEYVNRAYNEKFENLDQYKHENNFKRILNNLEIKNVKNAIKRSKKIMKNKIENENKLIEYKGYKYYTDNPSLSIWENVDKILLNSGILV